jgi:hypothetical protein
MKDDVSENIYVIGGNMQTLVAFMNGGIINENTRQGTRVKFSLCIRT